MRTWGPDSELARRGLDPSEALTLAEAARRAGVSAAVLRRAAGEGRLLHESVRRRGKEVAIVRLGDLAALYPVVLGEPDDREGREEREERGERGERDQPGQPDQPDQGEAPERSDRGESTEQRPTAQSSETPGAEPVPSRDEAPAAPAAAAGPTQANRASDGARHAIELRLAALQASNAALAAQVDDLKLVRGDLRDQSDDLRGRLTMLEKERRATTAGLLLAQRRLLELETGEPARTVASWRWPERGVLLASLIGLVVLGLAARRAGSELSDTLNEAAADRREFGLRIAGIEERSAQAAEALASEREQATALREQLLERLRVERVRADEVVSGWRSAVEVAERRETRAEAELARASAAATAAAEALEEARNELGVEREATRLERRRAAAALEEARRASEARLAELLREVETARASTAELVLELEHARAREAAARAAEREEALDPGAVPPSSRGPAPPRHPREVFEALGRWLLGRRSPGEP